MQHTHNPDSRFSIRTLSILAMLTALNIVLARFCSFNAWNTRIGFGFVPIAAAAMLYGPLAAALTAGLGDLLGALLFPTGTFFPGFTLTAALTGAVFGLFLSSGKGFPKADRPGSDRNLPDKLRYILPVLVNQLFFSLLLNTFWISILYGSPFRALLATRIFQVLLSAPVQIVTLIAMGSVMERAKGRLNPA